MSKNQVKFEGEISLLDEAGPFSARYEICWKKVRAGGWRVEADPSVTKLTYSEHEEVDMNLSQCGLHGDASDEFIMIGGN